ncbi:MAG: GNAT family N-acetyltransferase [Candidatus Pacearchaeota archaeon]|jgi:GNAT superfamily N-acetyltransferase
MKLKMASLQDLETIFNLRKDTIINVNGKKLPKKHIDYLLKLNSKEKILEKIKNKHLYVAIENNEIIGTIEYFNNEISGFYIRSNLVGKGFGKKMIKSMENKAKKEGSDEVHIICNISSAGFYEKNGYKIKEEKSVKEIGENEKIYFLEKKI